MDVVILDKELSDLINLLPNRVAGPIYKNNSTDKLLEIVLDLGRPPMARYTWGDTEIAMEPVTEEELKDMVSKVAPFNKDNRSGIRATLHRLSAIRNRNDQVVGITCRVGRAIDIELGSKIENLLKSGKSILLVGKPARGKTTHLRVISKLLSEKYNKRVMIIDTSNEIAGEGDVPHPAIGRSRRMQVKQPNLQHREMIEAVENHMPEVIIIDEMSTKLEAAAARTIAQRGVQLIATAHGDDMRSLLSNPELVDVIGGVATVTLGDDEAKRRGVQKSVQERQFQPTFDVMIELRGFDPPNYYIHTDVAKSVDDVLSSMNGGVENEQAADLERLWDRVQTPLANKKPSAAQRRSRSR